MTLTLAALSGLTAAQEFTRLDQCVPGARVEHRNGSVGTVVDNVDSCQVRLADGKVESWLFWMTRPAGASTNTTDSLVPGKYACYAGGNYQFMDLIIRSADSYEDSKGGRGSYRLDPSSQRITFLSGPMKDMHGKLLAGPRIGLNANGSNFHSTTCGLSKR